MRSPIYVGGEDKRATFKQSQFTAILNRISGLEEKEKKLNELASEVSELKENIKTINYKLGALKRQEPKNEQ